MLITMLSHVMKMIEGIGLITSEGETSKIEPYSMSKKSSVKIILHLIV